MKESIDRIVVDFTNVYWTFYAVIKYFRYTYTNGAVQLHEAYSPLNHETKRIGESIQNILHNSGIQALDENILNVTVPDISLELKAEEEVEVDRLEASRRLQVMDRRLRGRQSLLYQKLYKVALI